MLTNLRQYQRLVTEMVRNVWQKGEDWQAWSSFHQSQMLYFVQKRQAWVLVAVGSGVGTLVSFCLAIGTQNVWLWLVSLMTFCVLMGVSYYLVLCNRIMAELEAQTVEMWQNTRAAKSKPWLGVIQKIVEVVGQLVSNKYKRFRKKDDEK